MIQLHFGEIYGTKYESLIDNYSYYWIVTGISNGWQSSYVVPSCKRTGIYPHDAMGIRILITLPNTVKVSEESVATKTITSRGTDYIYNVWNIE